MSSIATISVLHVDDDPDFGELTVTMLEQVDERFVVETATSADEGFELLRSDRFDCVVSDYDMPGRNGIEFLESVREERADLPFILFTGKGSEEIASDAISAGVTDYLQKGSGSDQYTVLANRITNAVKRYEAERERRQWKQAVETATEGIAILDADGQYVQMNGAYADAYGTTPEELLGRSSAELYPDEVAEWFEEDVRPTLRREGTWEGEAIAQHTDGTRFEQQLSLAQLADGGHVCVMNDATDRRKRNEQFRKTSSRLEVLFEQSPDMINVHDGEGNFLDPNPQLIEKTGYDATELTDMRVWDLDQSIEPEEATALWEGMDPRDSERIEGVYSRRDGSTFPVEVHTRRLDLDDEDRFMAISRDITAQKERERKLEQLRERTQGLMHTETVAETAQHAVSAADDIIGAPLSGVTLVNEDETALESIAPADSVPDVFSEIPTFERDAPAGSRAALVWDVYRHGEPAYFDAFSTAERVAEDSPAESVVLHPLGDHGLFVISSTEPHAFTETDRLLVGILANNLEAALDRVEREQTLRRRETRLELLHEATRDLIQGDSRQEIAERVVGAAEDILDFSIASVRLYDPECSGLVPAAMSSTVPEMLPEREVFTPEDRSLNWNAFEADEVRVYDDIERLEYAVDQGTGVRSFMIFPMGEFGTIAVGETTPGAFDETDEFLTRILATAAETALRSHERKAQLQQRQRDLEQQNAHLDDFASVISHDLRNPLNVAKMQLELAAEEHDSPHLDAVASAHDRMTSLIEDLLALAREGEAIGEVEPVELEETVRNAWSVATDADDGSSLVIGADSAEELGRIEADSDRVRQLLENLLRNALEHNDGDVTVTVGTLDGGFYVADDGTGIEAEERDAIFETGYSGSDQGIGFGLSIVKRIVDAHGWKIDVTESSDGGARFEITGVVTA